jgi:hypothetical protein
MEQTRAEVQLLEREAPNPAGIFPREKAYRTNLWHLTPSVLLL